MSPDVLRESEEPADAAARVAAFRSFRGLPNEFWPAFLEAAAGLAGARAATLMIRPAGPEAKWRRALFWSAGGLPVAQRDAFLAGSEGACDACLANAGLSAQRTVDADALPAVTCAAVRLDTGTEGDTAAAAFLLDDGRDPSGGEALARLRLAADVPATYQAHRVVEQARADVERFAAVMDLMTLLNGERKFMAAAMTLSNEIASRHQCSRASLGWLEKGYARVQAVSHMEKFEKKMAAIGALERAMEEALDQDEELLWPLPPDSTAIARDHEQYAREQGAAFLCSLPLRLDGTTVAVLTCERADRAFSEMEVKHLRLCCDQAARRLGDLKRQSRWFGARWVMAAREQLKRLAGPEHTLAKAAGVLGALALGFLLFGRVEYRVKAAFTLRCEEIRHLPAPFDAYVSAVSAEKGQAVKAGDVLLQLDNRELLLEESSALADLSRYQREAEKARAQGALAEMRIAQAEAAQAQARLERVRYRLDRAVVRAPFDGVVVDGDWKERIGSPLRQGEPLFKVARLDRTYVEAAVREQDSQGVRVGAQGVVAFASQPAATFPVRVERIEPAAVTRSEGNVFLVRCALAEANRAAWWRPGMSGIARIRAGRRSPLWIISHRTVDYLRLRFG